MPAVFAMRIRELICGNRGLSTAPMPRRGFPKDRLATGGSLTFWGGSTGE